MDENITKGDTTIYIHFHACFELFLPRERSDRPAQSTFYSLPFNFKAIRFMYAAPFLFRYGDSNPSFILFDPMIKVVDILTDILKKRAKN